MTLKPPSTYPIVITDVTEVSLHASADLEFWRTRLEPLELFPFNDNGSAQFQVMAQSSKFNGIPFREFSISLALSRSADGSTHDGYFLNHAFNSVRLFAFFERAMFKTPYYHGQIEVYADPAASMGLRVRGQPVFSTIQSVLGASTRALEWWEGAIVLPDPQAPERKPQNYFFAKIGGDTEICPFVPGADSFAIAPIPTAPIFQHLIDSRLQPRAWHIRRRATHSKSSTVSFADASFGL